MNDHESTAPETASELLRETLVVGDLGVNCHLLARSDGRDCVLIDPGDEAEKIDAAMKRHDWTPAAILLTHAHYDHIGAVTALRTRYPGLTLMAGAETSRRIQDPRGNLSVLLGGPVRVSAAERIVEDGEAFTLAGIHFEPTVVPGHEPGEMVYGVREAGWLFTGDVLFAGSVGRSDFPGGDHGALIAGIKALLAKWPEETRIFPGHGPDTTVGREKHANPFL